MSNNHPRPPSTTEKNLMPPEPNQTAGRAGPLDLNELIPGIAKMLRRVVGEHITLETDLSPRPATIHADAGMMEEVLLNLAANARDAMPAGGRLQISTACVDIDSGHWIDHAGSKIGPHVCLSVRDTGTGIAPEVLPRLFEPSFPNKSADRCGLGLATVDSLVKQNGGWIEVESEIGAGTVFKVYLAFVSGTGRQPQPVGSTSLPITAAAPTGSRHSCCPGSE